MQLLLVEDEKRLAKAEKKILEEKKIMVDVAETGTDAYAMASTGAYDIIVLDVMLPGMDGITVAKKLRENKISTPIIMLTAKDSIRDKISGLDSGADDYMTKPFSPDELLARIRALTRRRGEVTPDTLEFGDIKYNISTCELSCGEKSIRFNYKESEILKLLMHNKNVIVSKDTIISKVWGYDSDAGDSNVEVYISFIRKKLTFACSKVKIVSVKKIGYKLELPEC